MSLYEQDTVREWFTRDRRDALHQHIDEGEARWWMDNNESVVAVLYRDVTYGPLVEVER